MVDYTKTREFWEQRGRNSAFDNLNVTMLRDRAPQLARYIHRAELSHLRRLATLDQSADVLDLGCGNGRLTIEFAKRARNVVAVDFSQSLLDRGREEASRRGLDNINWQRATVKEFHAEGTFDLIFLGGLLLCLNDEHVSSLLGKLRLMLKPDSLLISRDSVLIETETKPPKAPAEHEPVYRKASDYRCMFEAAGFEITYHNDLYAFPAFFYLYERLVPSTLKQRRVYSTLQWLLLNLDALCNPLLLHLPRLNRMLRGRRAKIVQTVTCCRRA